MCKTTTHINLMGNSLPDAYIFDLDGTLCELGDRLAFVKSNPKNWDAFFAGIPHDTVNDDVLELLDTLIFAGHAILLVTGRGHEYVEPTMEWLERHEIDYDELLMRNAGDRRPDDVVKKEIYLERIKPCYNVRGVFDDRLRVCRMWRELGLTCFAVAERDF